MKILKTLTLYHQSRSPFHFHLSFLFTFRGVYLYSSSSNSLLTLVNYIIPVIFYYCLYFFVELLAIFASHNTALCREKIEKRLKKIIFGGHIVKKPAAFAADCLQAYHFSQTSFSPKINKIPFKIVTN